MCQESRVDPFPRFRGLGPLGVERPLVSVIMFCRNRAKFIRGAVESILGQSYENWELVIQDGASTDGTREIIEEYRDSRIKLVSEPDAGPFDAMWRCIRRTQGEVVASCLSDEELLPETLARGVQYFLCNPQAGAVFGDLNFTDPEGNILARQNCTEFNFQDYLGFESVLTLQATLFRRSALSIIGAFSDRKWRTDCADFEIMIRLGESFRMDYLPGVVGQYKQFHEGQLSTTPSVGFFCAIGQLRLIDEFFRENPQRSLLREIPLRQAYECIRSLYVRKGESELLGKLDAFFDSLQVKAAPDSLQKAQQAASIGKLIVALEMLPRLEVTPENWSAFFRLQAEIMEQLSLPKEAAESWEWQADHDSPGTFERCLIAQLSSPSITAAEILAKQKKWAARQLPSSQSSKLGPIAKGGSEKIHLAFHAADWASEEIRLQVLPMLPLLDSSFFRLSCYGRLESDRGCLPAEIEFQAFSTETADHVFCEKVRNAHVDIFVELSGLQPGHRFGAMAIRCAPVQISYLGEIATRGMRQIDYQIVDDVVCPSGFDKYFTEQLLRLDKGPYSCFVPGAEFQNSLIYQNNGTAPRRLDERFTFACFAPGATMNQLQMEAWGTILTKVPSSRFLLSNPELSSSDARKSIRGKLTAMGVNPEQISIVPRSENGLSPYLLAQCDLYLDTFPRSHALGIVQALARGVPAVTLAGEIACSRLGASLLTCCGLPDAITRSRDEYIAQAITLARDAERLLKLKESLPDKLWQAGVTNPPLFTSGFQTALKKVLTSHGRL